MSINKITTEIEIIFENNLDILKQNLSGLISDNDFKVIRKLARKVFIRDLTARQMLFLQKQVLDLMKFADSKNLLTVDSIDSISDALLDMYNEELMCVEDIEEIKPVIDNIVKYLM